MFELLGFVGELVLFGATTQMESDKEGDHANFELLRLAREVEGTAKDPWFGRRRVDGRYRGRELELRYLGDGEVEINLEAPEIREFELSSPWIWQRIFSAAPRLSGWLPEDAYDAASSLMRRFNGSYVWAAEGKLHVRAQPGLCAEAMGDLLVATGEVLDACREVKIR